MGEALEFVKAKMEMESSQYAYDSIGAYLSELTPIYEERIDERRWWTVMFRVVDIDGTLIGFDWAHTTGDKTPDETGWEFDESTICFVRKEQKVSTIYMPDDDEPTSGIAWGPKAILPIGGFTEHVTRLVGSTTEYKYVPSGIYFGEDRQLMRFTCGNKQHAYYDLNAEEFIDRPDVRFSRISS